MNALIIGGTRNLGPPLAAALAEAGYDLTVFNRGQTPGSLPEDVTRVYGDRSDRDALRRALQGLTFDLVVDTTLYNGPDAEAIAEILAGRVGRYIFLSTGQVYLVRVGTKRPYRERDYEGPLIAAPPRERSFDHANWMYGVEKREAEDALMRAYEQDGFPVTTLRLPMVNSERDHYDRLLGYLARLRDGGPILVPKGEHLPLRHVYGEDVVRAVVHVAGSDGGIGRTYNVSQDETLSFEGFLNTLGELAGREPWVVRVPYSRLEAEGLVPHCSPFSEPWMSALDNALGKSELGLRYTPAHEYLDRLVAHFTPPPDREPLGYRHRDAELRIAREYAD